MLTQLHKLPVMYASTIERIIMMCFMTDDAQKLGLYAFDAASEFSFKSEHDEMTLSVLKNRARKGMSWHEFFETVTLSFSKNCVSAQKITRSNKDTPSEESVDKRRTVFSVDELHLSCYSIEFILVRTTEDMQAYILERMIRTQRLISHPKEYQRILLQVMGDETIMRGKCEKLNVELQSLQKLFLRTLQQVEAKKTRLLELRKIINLETKKQENNPWVTVREKQRRENPGNAARVPNPLIDHTCKDFDKDLLRLIKSRWIKEEQCDLASPANRVVQPYSSEELADRIKNFSNAQHQSIWEALDKIDDWDYSVFDIQIAMTGDHCGSLSNQPNGGSLFVTLYALLCKYNFMQEFGMDEQIVLNWISVVEGGYHANPYHNSMHAADVVQITHYIISRGGLAYKCELTRLQMFSAVFAAAIHDFDHPGINNQFHIRTRSYLATLYNDRSVLENLHVSNVFELMRNPEFNILASFHEEQRREVRETVIEMVLATDMSMHEKYLAQLKKKLQERAVFTNHENQILALALALKMADVSNCGRPLDIYLQWSAKISDEFYQQGDRERQLGMYCSPFMDRLQPSMGKGQVAFINFIVIPFFEQLAVLLPDLHFAVDFAEKTKKYRSMHDNLEGNGISI
ncbi:unnamed protein product [Phytomonas sp. EM1]|nr:unnamed protein product [Phytomonas sp. EM1]|eukprot:CCW64950.1 unnamed protein product [Phytomonas sp. isolate EM1]